jgi:hypothetical protein
MPAVLLYLPVARFRSQDARAPVRRAAAGLPVVVVTSRQVRSLARATGQLARTDRIDAGVLALLATRLDAVIRALRLRLLAAGKPKTHALVTCMRKLLTILNTMARTGEHGSTEHACQVLAQARPRRESRMCFAENG